MSKAVLLIGKKTSNGSIIKDIKFFTDKGYKVN